MLTLLRRPLREAPAIPTFYALTAVAAFAFSACFTLNLVFQYRVIGLDPLQMVLVGTVLELTCFLFEVPTGVVADLWSRRVSVIIGFVLIGAGFAVEGIVATFAAAIVGNVVWGIGYTFTSGALQAWITDEVGEAAVAPVFTRETQIDLGFTIVGTLAAGALGLISLRVPIIVAGATLILLGIGLWVVMPERNFQPTPRGERETYAHLKAQFVAGLTIARTRRVVRVFLLVSVLAGLASEVFDRLWQVRVLDSFAMPEVFGGDEAIAFTVFALIGTVVSLLASLASGRWLPRHVIDAHPGLPVAIAAAAQMLAVAGLALVGNLWLALAFVWLRGAAMAFSGPIEAAWLARNLDSSTRATVLSMNSQANAIGQVVGGPPLGALATRTSIPVALLVAAVVQAPSVAAFWRIRRLGAPAQPVAESSSS
ncbi:DHA3 family tetracycline resistance protein-like MFS transporter [Humibacillus xanthopallidus]|uniref:DHA3 family tetracycline resistance protein-like MFS transporter n=1 Tax=Humibacillus xanthopallidus TaxID=412689 RepID=A0A543PQW4_9MICO|nr:MFS transporter [Humibacillus xanthopallidus]TQN46465.1 DHA3 family tetracycline resistance protein-like MFS transporter [Humibacillus xanthopallidus]